MPLSSCLLTRSCILLKKIIYFFEYAREKEKNLTFARGNCLIALVNTTLLRRSVSRVGRLFSLLLAILSYFREAKVIKVMLSRAMFE